MAGTSASGITDLSPTGVFDQGLALANKILNSVEGLGILEGFFLSLVAAFTALVVVVSFAIIAAQLLVAFVERFIVIGAGIPFVGFFPDLAGPSSSPSGTSATSRASA